MPVLNRELAAITGIPEEVLYRYGQSRNSDTKVKFGWVRGRETTRVEDMSYCLFGIFGVFLPTLYGEKGNARERLVEEIKKRRKPTTYLSPACFPCLYTPEGLRANQQFRVPDFRPAGSRRWWAGTPQRVDAGRVKSIPVAAPPSRSAPGPAGRYANDHIPSAPVYQNRPILNNTQYQQGPAPGEVMNPFGPVPGGIPTSFSPLDPVPCVKYQYLDDTCIQQRKQPGLFGRLKKRITRED
nr:hypothetical protein B0A51_14021 [Rachicladosporium sp. CCFEE 5018]